MSSEFAPGVDENLLSAIRAISDQGFPNVATFFKAFLSSSNVQVQKLVDQLLRNHELFEGIVKLLMDKSFYGPTRRRTARRTEIISASFSKQLVDWVLKILSRELAQVAANPQAKLSPSSVCIFPLVL